jgi:homoserine kinase
MSSTARVRVPATTANLGPGFDSLGIALRLSNTVTVSRTENPASDAMVLAAADLFFTTSGQASFPFSWSIHGAVPRSRGLGSSVTVRLGVLHGLNELADRPLSPDALYRLCAQLEGHPDNAAPAAFGGFTVARSNGDYQRFRVASRLRFALLIPDFEIETDAARAALPATIPFADAVRNVANTAAITAAFASANYRALSGCFADSLHQPHRTSLIPCLDPVIAAAEKAGALGGWLSGSGSTIACLVEDHAEAVAKAMREAAQLPKAHVLVTTADNRGVRVLPSR